MFENASGKLKTLAKVLFVIESAVCIICGVWLCFRGLVNPYWPEIPLPMLLLLLIGGPVASYVKNLALYAIGEAADVQSIRSTMTYYGEEQKKAMKQLTGNTAEPAKKAPPMKATSWKCKKCGEKNAASDIYCRNCGEYR